MKRQRNEEQVIDDGEERSGDGMKSVDPRKRDDDKINSKREDEQVTLERSGDGMKSVDPQKRDHKIKRKRHREGETVIDDDEERMKSVDPQKKDDEVNRKREAEPVIDDGEKRSGDGTKSDDPQKRDDKIKRKKKDEQVTDDGEERSVDLTTSDDPQKIDDKINRRREDDEEIISEWIYCSSISFGSGDGNRALSTDEAEDIIWEWTLYSGFPFGSGDGSRALSTDEAEDIISSMTAPPTDDKINRGREDDQEIFSKMILRSSISFGSGDGNRALSVEKAEDIISRTIISMTATPTTPSTSNNPAGAIQAPPPRQTAQVSPLSKVASSLTKCFKGAQ